MSRNLSFVEPHPSVPTSGAYLSGGRGGAGNYQRYTSSQVTQGPTATGPPSLLTIARRTTTRQFTGRGGAGNRLTAEEPAIFPFDEEMLKRREHLAPVYHFGRGGSGNAVNETKLTAPRSASTSSVTSASSTSSAGSVRRGLDATVGRLSRKITGS